MTCDRKALTLVDHHAEVPEYGLRSVALGHILDDNHVVRAVRRLGESEMQGFQVTGDHNRLDLVQSFNAALHLLGFGCLVSEALYELLGAFDLRLLALESSLELLYLQPSLLLVEGIVSAVACEPCIEELVDLVYGIVQKAFVVAYDQERALEGFQEALEPETGLDVQVVGGLVQHHQVRALAENLGQCNSHLVSARELVAGSVHIGRSESESLCNGIDNLLAVVVGAVQKAFLELVELDQEGFGMVGNQLGLDLALTSEVLLEARKALLHLLVHGIVSQDDIALRQIGNAHASGLGDLTAVRGHQTCHDLHQSGLAFPVAACKGCTCMLAQRERHA